MKQILLLDTQGLASGSSVTLSSVIGALNTSAASHVASEEKRSFLGSACECADEDSEGFQHEWVSVPLSAFEASKLEQEPFSCSAAVNSETLQFC